MKKAQHMMTTVIFAAMTVACGSAQNESPNMTLQVYPPAQSVNGTTTRVEYQNPENGEFEILAELPVVSVGDIRTDGGNLEGLLVELGDPASNTPSFSTMIYFDDNLAAGPVKIQTAVPVGAEVKVQIQLVSAAEEKVYPVSVERVLTARAIPVQELPVPTVQQ